MVAGSNHGLRRESTRVGHRIDESGLVDARSRWLGGTCRCCNILVLAPSDIETEGRKRTGYMSTTCTEAVYFL
jgi:hypothetical protein